MARIDDRILRSVIYFYHSTEDAERDAQSGGSGFLVSVASDTDPEFIHIYAVTCAHVVFDEKPSNQARVIRTTAAFRWNVSLMTGDREIIPVVSDSDWTRHPEGDDVAISYLGVDQVVKPIGVEYGHRFSYTIPSFLLITTDVLTAFDIGPGDDVYMCGRFQHYPGKYFNDPSTRWGAIALMPAMIKTKGVERELFLIEMRSLSGFSGSPVAWRLPLDLEFYLTALSEMRNLPPPYPVMTRRVRRDKSGPMLLGPWLVGVDRGSFPHKYGVYDQRSGRKTTYEVEAHSGVAGVVPAWKIRELLDLEKFKMVREEKDRELDENKKRDNNFIEDVMPPDDPLTGETFDQVLRRVSRKVTDSDFSEPESKAPQTNRQK